jgi:hypothetical protein
MKKNPGDCKEKVTNHVLDIYGTATGTGGQGIHIYRHQKQHEALERSAAALARGTQVPVRAKGPQAARDREADVAAVKALN